VFDKNEFVESVIKRELGIDEIIKEAGEGGSANRVEFLPGRRERRIYTLS